MNKLNINKVVPYSRYLSTNFEHNDSFNKKYSVRGKTSLSRWWVIERISATQKMFSTPQWAVITFCNWLLITYFHRVGDKCERRCAWSWKRHDCEILNYIGRGAAAFRFRALFRGRLIPSNGVAHQLRFAMKRHRIISTMQKSFLSRLCVRASPSPLLCFFLIVSPRCRKQSYFVARSHLEIPGWGVSFCVVVALDKELRAIRFVID